MSTLLYLQRKEKHETQIDKIAERKSIEAKAVLRAYENILKQGAIMRSICYAVPYNLLESATDNRAQYLQQRSSELESLIQNPTTVIAYITYIEHMPLRGILEVYDYDLNETEKKTLDLLMEGIGFKYITLASDIESSTSQETPPQTNQEPRQWKRIKRK